MELNRRRTVERGPGIAGLPDFFLDSGEPSLEGPEMSLLKIDGGGLIHDLRRPLPSVEEIVDEFPAVAEDRVAQRVLLQIDGSLQIHCVLQLCPEP